MTSKSPTTVALAKWMGTVTHILDTLADAYGLQIDREELINSYNQISGETWTTGFVKEVPHAE